MAIPLIVLDTNVVLDWLLFDDPSCRPLAAAIDGRRVRWIATPAMRDELAEVLRRGLAANRNADPGAVLAGFDARADMQPEPVGMPPGPALVCTDADDQKFIDFALDARASWLLSRDRAVLRLAKRASSAGLHILAPQAWSLPREPS